MDTPKHRHPLGVLHPYIYDEQLLSVIVEAESLAYF